MKFHITHLYPHHMELYGDMGNIRAVWWTLEQMGIEVQYQPIMPGESLPDTTHWYFIGGGQDRQQLEVSDDLIGKGSQIIKDVNNGVPLLAICGGYQLLGREFLTGDGISIPGVGLFPVVTKALNTSIQTRSIGDIVLDSTIPGLSHCKFVGFENHSGQTYVDLSGKNAHYMGRVLVGKGNNIEEDFEGCVVNNAIGTYLHGSCLPKNPELTEFIIRAGLKYSKYEGEVSFPDQSIARMAKEERIKKLT